MKYPICGVRNCLYDTAMRRLNRWVFDIAAVTSGLMLMGGAYEVIRTLSQRRSTLALFALQKWPMPAGINEFYRDYFVRMAIAAIVPVTLLAAWLIERNSHRTRYGAGLCQRCGYDMTGNLSGVCPECGNPKEIPMKISD
jgi:uncharacterized membrane protein YcfT